MSSSARNIELVIEYDGTPYLGWQRQKDGPSVEAEIETAIERVTGAHPKLIVAGRTDAGVHARAQVVNFYSDTGIDAWRIAHALNAHLPETITIHRSRDMPPEFSARLDSIAKRYRYRIYRGPHLPALERNRVWHHRAELDLSAMRRAGEHLVGELDFESFRSVHCDAEHAIREMFSIDIQETARAPTGEFVDLTFHANAFCRHMCRILAGTLCDVARGKIDAHEIPRIRDARDRTQAGITAPAAGLTLLEVIYP
ncbi:MAG: tRNA pseudouridine(38-40) synthase TruA [Myxococcota bacterium]